MTSYEYNLLSEEEKRSQDSIQSTSDDLVDSANRKLWLQQEYTKVNLYRLESHKQNISSRIIMGAMNINATHLQFLAIELQTLTKVLNLLQDGKYEIN